MNKCAFIESGVVKQVVLIDDDAPLPNGYISVPDNVERHWILNNGFFEPPREKEENEESIRQQSLEILLQEEREKALHDLIEEKIKPAREKYESLTTEQLVKQVQARKRR